MSDLNARIQKYYQDFRNDFCEENFPEVFSRINAYNASTPASAHKLGCFAIFYTPIQQNPSLMIIGNNPSWFDKDSPTKAYGIVQGLMTGPPSENSYLVHNHVFAHRLQDAFNRIGRFDLLRDCVGMNRLWLQTGPENAHWNRACGSYSGTLGLSLNDYCENKTKEIIQLIAPRVALLVGAKSQKLSAENTSGDTNIIHVSYPLGAGINILQQELQNIVSKYEI